MKKLITLIALVFAFSITANAQNYAKSFISASATAIDKTIDTVTNTGVINMTLPLATPVRGPRQTVTVSAVVSKISGTAGGTVILQGSIDGVNYSTVAATQLQGGETATFTLTNVASQTYHWVVLNAPFLYYKTTITGTGTVVESIASKVLSN